MRSLNGIKVKYIVLATIIIAVLLSDFFGLFLHAGSKSYLTEFSWPLDGPVGFYAENLKRGEKADVDPINDHNYFMIKKAKGKCVLENEDDMDSPNGKIRLIYIVKSTATNFKRRSAIRRTWGFERRFSDVPIKTVFLLGSRKADSTTERLVNEEAEKFNDIVLGDFEDTYFNNTIKTMMGLRWAVEQCPRSRFYMFVDDDYYISTKNILRFLRNPLNYPGYLEDPVLSFDDSQKANFPGGRKLQQLIDFDLPDDVKLYTGHVINSRPLRHKMSKWFVPLEEYPYDRWPPYVTAGAYVLSNEALKDMYYASYFVKRFRFDDIYLALVAKKIDLEPLHSDEFHFDRKPYTVKGYRYVVASHGFSDPDELVRLWTQQKEAGNA